LKIPSRIIFLFFLLSNFPTFMMIILFGKFGYSASGG